MFSRSETATILAAVNGTQFSLFIFYQRSGGMVSVTAQLIVLTPKNAGGQGIPNLSEGKYS